RKHGSEPRSARRHVRARRLGVRCRSGRGISLPLRCRSPPPASLDARRLAAAAVDFRARLRSCRRSEARPYPDARALEDARQSAPLALRARAVARVPLGLDVARARRRELDAVRPRRHRRAPASAARHRHHSPSRRYLPAHPYPQSCARFHAGIHADTFRLHLPSRAAWLSLDAIVRTVFRLFIRRHMLEWMSFARSNYDRRSDLKGLALQLAGSLAFAGVTAAIVLAAEPSNAPFASAFLALWALSPLIARWASAPRDVEAHREIDADERKG